MKNTFYFVLKVLLVLAIFTFLFRHFGYIERDFMASELSTFLDHQSEML